MADPKPQFGEYLKKLRKERGLTLKQVEAKAKVSNAYISQLERGIRNPPHPEILKRLAIAYDVPHRDLLIIAGYLAEETEADRSRRRVEKAFDYVLNDSNYRYGTRLKATSLSLEAKRFIVEMYEKATGRKLLEEFA